MLCLDLLVELTTLSNERFEVSLCWKASSVYKLLAFIVSMRLGIGALACGLDLAAENICYTVAYSVFVTSCKIRTLDNIESHFGL